MLDKCEILLPKFSPRYPKCAILNGVHPADDLESLGCWGRRHESKIGHNKGTKALPRTRTACQALPKPDKDTGADKARMKFDDPIVWQL